MSYIDDLLTGLFSSIKGKKKQDDDDDDWCYTCGKDENHCTCNDKKD